MTECSHANSFLLETFIQISPKYNWKWVPLSFFITDILLTQLLAIPSRTHDPNRETDFCQVHTLSVDLLSNL